MAAAAQPIGTTDATQPGIDPQAVVVDAGLQDACPQPQPYNADAFARLGVLDAWRRYSGYLTWGRGQTLACLDDGCDVTIPEWRASLPWGPKVLETWNSIEDNEDCMHQGPGYHGTTVGLPSSMNHGGVHGVAYNDQVVHVRCCTVVHLVEDEAATIAKGLQWVIDHHRRLNITTINLAPVDDQPHAGTVATAIDAKLRRLRELNVWVSAPTANNHYTTGISWPACAIDCFAIGAAVPTTGEVHLDRYANVDLLAAATATSSSNAYAAGAAIVIREAIERTGYRWSSVAPTLPDAIMHIMRASGRNAYDPATGLMFRELNLAAALQMIFGV